MGGGAAGLALPFSAWRHGRRGAGAGAAPAPTCVGGRAQAGVVAGPAQTGAAVLAGVVPAVVRDGAARRPLEALGAEAPAGGTRQRDRPSPAGPRSPGSPGPCPGHNPGPCHGTPVSCPLPDGCQGFAPAQHPHGRAGTCSPVCQGRSQTPACAGRPRADVQLHTRVRRGRRGWMGEGSEGPCRGEGGCGAGSARRGCWVATATGSEAARCRAMGAGANFHLLIIACFGEARGLGQGQGRRRGGGSGCRVPGGRAGRQGLVPPRHACTHMKPAPSPAWGWQVPPLAQGRLPQLLRDTSQSRPWPGGAKGEGQSQDPPGPPGHSAQGCRAEPLQAAGCPCPRGGARPGWSPPSAPHLVAAGAGAAVGAERVVVAGAAVLAGAGHAGVALGLDAQGRRTCGGRSRGSHGPGATGQLRWSRLSWAPSCPGSCQPFPLLSGSLPPFHRAGNGGTEQEWPQQQIAAGPATPGPVAPCGLAPASPWHSNFLAGVVSSSLPSMSGGPAQRAMPGSL